MGKVKLGEVKVKSSGGANNRSINMQGVPYSPEDAWAVTPDGRIAIVRAADYHLEWKAADRPVVRGPAIAAKGVPVRDAEKREYAADLRNGISCGDQRERQDEHADGSRRAGRAGRRDQIPDLEWPATQAGVPRGARRAGRQRLGRAVVAAGAPREYDVFGADGKVHGKSHSPRGSPSGRLREGRGLPAGDHRGGA